MRLSPDKAKELELELARVRSVSSARIVLEENGSIASVAVLTDVSRKPKFVAKDIENLVQDRVGASFDYRKVEVTQLEDVDHFVKPQNPDDEIPGPTAVPDDPRTADLVVLPGAERVRLAAVHSTVRDGSLSVEVELTHGSFEAKPGRAEGPGHDPASSIGLVASATLEAVRNLLHSGYEALVKEARILPAGGDSLVLVVVDFGSGRKSQRLAGVCIQRGSLYETAVYATLDAINRPLGEAKFRQLVSLDGGSRAPVDGKNVSGA